jgi:hypothetical protein
VSARVGKKKVRERLEEARDTLYDAEHDLYCGIIETLGRRRSMERLHDDLEKLRGQICHAMYIVEEIVPI